MITSALLITAIIILAALIGALLTYVVFQSKTNAELRGRIQGIGAQLRNMPKRRTDKISE